MFSSKNDVILKIHLIISVIIVVPAALLYGFFPDAFLELFPETQDELSFFKANMGIYLAFSVLWLLGIFKNNFLKIALISNIAFMLGLGIGRTTSVIFDGTPSAVYVFGMVGELILGMYGIWVLNRLKRQFSKKQ